MTACSFAVSAHVCWNWAVRAARTAIPLFILGRTLSTCRSLDMRRLGSIRRFCRAGGHIRRCVLLLAQMWATQYKRAPLSRYAGCVFAKKPTASRQGDTLMKNTIKYVGLDGHQSTVSVAVLDAEGKLVMQSILATHAAAILDFVHGVRGSLQVTFEEGTQSAWLYDLLVRHVAKVVVCNPRKNALLKAGNKSDQIDARKLAELLRAGLLSPVYHGENSYRILQELVRSYTTLTEDTT